MSQQDRQRPHAPESKMRSPIRLLLVEDPGTAPNRPVYAFTLDAPNAPLPRDEILECFGANGTKKIEHIYYKIESEIRCKIKQSANGEHFLPPTHFRSGVWEDKMLLFVKLVPTQPHAPLGASRDEDVERRRLSQLGFVSRAELADRLAKHPNPAWKASIKNFLYKLDECEWDGVVAEDRTLFVLTQLTKTLVVSTMHGFEPFLPELPDAASKRYKLSRKIFRIHRIGDASRTYEMKVVYHTRVYAEAGLGPPIYNTDLIVLESANGVELSSEEPALRLSVFPNELIMVAGLSLGPEYAIDVQRAELASTVGWVVTDEVDWCSHARVHTGNRSGDSGGGLWGQDSKLLGIIIKIDERKTGFASRTRFLPTRDICKEVEAANLEIPYLMAQRKEVREMQRSAAYREKYGEPPIELASHAPSASSSKSRHEPPASPPPERRRRRISGGESAGGKRSSTAIALGRNGGGAGADAYEERRRKMAPSSSSSSYNHHHSRDDERRAAERCGGDYHPTSSSSSTTMKSASSSGDYHRQHPTSSSSSTTTTMKSVSSTSSSSSTTMKSASTGGDVSRR